jgi:hypothetical protein
MNPRSAGWELPYGPDCSPLLWFKHQMTGNTGRGINRSVSETILKALRKEAE